MKTKQHVVSIVLAFACVCAFAQDNKTTWKLSGYVQNQVITDSRESVTALDGLVVLYPKPANLDAQGNDINAAWNLSYLSISTRLRLSVFGPEILNAKTGAVVEADFTATNSVFRFRHGYMFFDWSNTHLLMGQTWHPFMSPDAFPQVITSSLGAPYQPFSRAPQILLRQNLGDAIYLQGALVFQNEFSSFGPDNMATGGGNVKSSTYTRHSMVPNTDIQLQYKGSQLKMGLIWDMKCVMPSQYNIVGTDKYKTNARLFSQAYQAYASYTSGKWLTIAKFIYGQNLSDMLLMGGYGVKSVDPITGEKQYTNSNDIYSFVNVYYNADSWKFGIFGGYAKNLGMSDNLANGNVYGRQLDIDRTYRVSPTVTWQNKNFSLTFEPEMTTAFYGNIDANDKGKVKDASGVTDYRMELTARYKF